MSGKPAQTGQQEKAAVSRRRFLATTAGAAAGLGALSAAALDGQAASADEMPGRTQYRGYAEAGMAALQAWYDTATGLWHTTNWWNAANALNAVIQYTQRTNDETYAGAVANTFTQAQAVHPNFTNSYYDDTGWWALTWVDAYDLTRDSRYLDTAKNSFAYIAASWGGGCGGGVWWNTAKSYKNAIANELFLSLAAALHLRTPGDRGQGSYLDWALQEWNWFRGSGLINSSGLINDGLNSSCQNNGGTTWTYNQGVILGGLASMYQITHDRSFLDQGEIIADAALRHLTNAQGILIEPCETTSSSCNADQTQFKGIFARNLYAFYLESRRPAYRDFILRNASSIWATDRNTASQFGLRWAGPFDTADASRQSSAQDALNAAVGLFGPPQT